MVIIIIMQKVSNYLQNGRILQYLIDIFKKS